MLTETIQRPHSPCNKGIRTGKIGLLNPRDCLGDRFYLLQGLLQHGIRITQLIRPRMKWPLYSFCRDSLCNQQTARDACSKFYDVSSDGFRETRNLNVPPYQLNLLKRNKSRLDSQLLKGITKATYYFRNNRLGLDCKQLSCVKSVRSGGALCGLPDPNGTPNRSNRSNGLNPSSHLLAKQLWKQNRQPNSNVKYAQYRSNADGPKQTQVEPCKGLFHKSINIRSMSLKARFGTNQTAFSQPHGGDI